MCTLWLGEGRKDPHIEGSWEWGANAGKGVPSVCGEERSQARLGNQPQGAQALVQDLSSFIAEQDPVPHCCSCWALLFPTWQLPVQAKNLSLQSSKL